MGSERSRHVVPAILIAAVTLTVALVHRPVLTAPILAFDDALYIRDNDLVPNPGWASTRRVFIEVLSPTVPGYYEPLSMLSLMGDYAMGGRADDLRPFHRTSLVLHLLVTAQIVVLTHLLFRNPWTAAMTGLLFGLHPMTIEPIALEAPKTKLLAGKLQAMGLGGKGDSVLVITDSLDENLWLASRNLAHVLVVEPKHADPVSLVHFSKVLITRPALAMVQEMLG